MVYILSIFLVQGEVALTSFMSARGTLKSPISFLNISEICSNLILEDGVLNEGVIKESCKMCRKNVAKRRQKHLGRRNALKGAKREKMSAGNSKQMGVPGRDQEFNKR